MTRFHRNAPLLFAAFMAACQQAPVLNALAPGHAVVVAGPHEGGPSLILSVGLAEGAGGYGLLAESGSTNSAPVHRWVGADLVRYDVELRRRSASSPSQFEALIPALAVEIPVNAQGSGTASFTKLQPGAYYRAYVKAMGRKGGAAGTDAVVQLNANATADFADFDFTGNNDVAAQSSQTVSVRLDDVAFSGQGGLAIGSPLPGGYASPTGALAISPILPPTPAPAQLRGTFTVGGGPQGLAIDAADNLWVANFGNGSGSTVSKLSSVGVPLATHTVGSGPWGVLVDPQGVVWVSVNAANQVLRLDSQGTALGSVAVASPRGMCRDTQGNVWVCSFSGAVTKLSSQGSVLGSFAGSGGNSVAVDAGGRVWTVRGAAGVNNVFVWSGTGSLLAAWSIGNSPSDVALDSAGHAWVVDGGNPGSVWAFEATGSSLGSWPVGVQPYGVTVDAQDRVWVANRGSARVDLLSSSGSPLGSYAVGSGPRSVVTKGGTTWVGNFSGNSVTLIR